MSDVVEGVLGQPLIDQGDGFARLLRRARDGSLPHALLISGARGTGKSLAAQTLTMALLCREGTPTHACGACAVCRKIAAEGHSDVHRLQPPEDKRDIPVESVRELQVTLARAPVEGDARVAWIDPADGLNEQGQNALLKTLEEPFPGTYLLLVSRRPEGLLPTVRSRVQRFGMLPLGVERISSKLGAESLGQNETRTWAARAAGGSLGRGRWLLGREAGAIQDLVVPFLAGDETLGAVALAKSLLDGATGPGEKRQRAASVLEVLRALHRGGLEGLLEGDPPAAYDPGSVDPWTWRAEYLFDAEEDLALQIPPDQVLAGLFLRWQDRSAPRP